MIFWARLFLSPAVGFSRTLTNPFLVIILAPMWAVSSRSNQIMMLGHMRRLTTMIGWMTRATPSVVARKRNNGLPLAKKKTNSEWKVVVEE
jgi:hypothetical protein